MLFRIALLDIEEILRFPALCLDFADETEDKLFLEFGFDLAGELLKDVDNDLLPTRTVKSQFQR